MTLMASCLLIAFRGWRARSTRLTSAGSRHSAPVERYVAVEAAAGKPGGPAALCVEERELAGHRSELAPEDVIEHPSLDRHPAACGLEDAQRTCLLGEVDEGGGRDLPV